MLLSSDTGLELNAREATHHFVTTVHTTQNAAQHVCVYAPSLKPLPSMKPNKIPKSQVTCATDRRRWCPHKCRPCLRVSPALQTIGTTRRFLAWCYPKHRPEIFAAARRCSQSRGRDHAQNAQTVRTHRKHERAKRISVSERRTDLRPTSWQRSGHAPRGKCIKRKTLHWSVVLFAERKGEGSVFSSGCSTLGT